MKEKMRVATWTIAAMPQRNKAKNTNRQKRHAEENSAKNGRASGSGVRSSVTSMRRRMEHCTGADDILSVKNGLICCGPLDSLVLVRATREHRLPEKLEQPN